MEGQDVILEVETRGVDFLTALLGALKLATFAQVKEEFVLLQKPGFMENFHAAVTLQSLCTEK